MNYYSLNNKSLTSNFKQAAITGIAPDGGLYFPEFIPKLYDKFLANLSTLSEEEIGLKVMQPYVGNEIDKANLEKIIAETINFNFPVVKIREALYSLELYHGPTLAFKDVGARFMSRCLSYFNQNNNKKITVLVATSGDTGGAVANGFLGVDGVEVIILYPKNKVSAIQELQLTTLGQNIIALEVDGTFDDCQAIVKQAFVDDAVNAAYQLTSANSINVARWLPQQLYYFFAAKEFKNQLPIFCVPSGNFGNICAGILAWASGLPVHHFIAACNTNNVVQAYLQTQNYQPQKAVPTLSNAMDVGNPSNFVRILEIFNHQFPELKNKLSSYSITDEETISTLKQIHQNYTYIADPHGAVGFASAEQYLQENNSIHPIIVLETAHPIKFDVTVQNALGINLDYPASVQHLLTKRKQTVKLDSSYSTFKDWMMSR